MISNSSQQSSSIKQASNVKKGRKSFKFSIEKRHKFVIGTVLLSLGLFFAEFQFGKSGIFIPVIIAILTTIILYWAIHPDLKENRTLEAFILPFFYSLSFGMFYFLTPTAFAFRLVLAAIFAFGLYSVFLSQNILSISSIRTITLLSGARIVSFVATLLSFFFLTNIVFTLHLNIFVVIILMIIYSSALIFHSLWTYTLIKPSRSIFTWVFILTACLIEAASLLWFWPSSPTFIALFLTGFFYAIVGLSHIWFERRLFKGIMWEYVWVGCLVFFVLILFTPWGK
ncbi:MAG TPA: hypothetical protein VM077_04005 [Candidatus Limnocylindrales bacterium]|nr:hypothetical protein [Candidatus Limnocylindrales bacterium]